MNDERLIIIGAGGHGKVVADIAYLCGYKDIIFLDSNESLIGKKIGYRSHVVCGTPLDIDQFNGDVFVAIGDSHTRRKLLDFYLFEKNRNVASLMHPNAFVSEGALIEDGVVVMPGAVINTDTTVGSGSIINTCSSVDHDCFIDEDCHIAPGAHICGGVKTGRGCWIGAGSTIINNLEIASNVYIGAGAVVLNNIHETGTYVGVPALKIK